MFKISVVVTGLGLLVFGVVSTQEGEEIIVPDTVRSETISPLPEGRDITDEFVISYNELEIGQHNIKVAEREAELEAKRLAKEKQKKAEEEARALAEAEAKRVAQEQQAQQAQATAVAQAQEPKSEPVKTASSTQDSQPVSQPSSQPASSYLLAQLVESEATGEPYAGKVAVAEVVLNRVRDGGFPNSIEGVVYQPGQFQVVSNGRINMIPTQESINASNEALAGSNYTYGALYFFNAAIATDRWQDSLRTTTVIGSHTFNAKN